MQNIPCFGPTSSAQDAATKSTGVITPFDDSESESLGPFLHVGDPIALLIQCETLVVLAVAQVNRLHFASQSDLNELAVHFLADPSAKIDCQLLQLVPASIEDDPTQVHDWCWSTYMEATCENVGRQYVHLLNPSISVLRAGKPTFLFESSFLVNLSCAMFQDLQPEDHQHLPVVKRTETFPYRMLGKLQL